MKKLKFLQLQNFIYFLCISPNSFTIQLAIPEIGFSVAKTHSTKQNVPLKYFSDIVTQKKLNVIITLAPYVFVIKLQNLHQQIQHA